MCMHRNSTRPFARRMRNPRAGLPVYEGDRLKMKDGKIVTEPDHFDAGAYITCLDCGQVCDYDIVNFQRIGKWKPDVYVHSPVKPYQELAVA